MMFRVLAGLAAAVSFFVTPSVAAVRIVVGPTPIVGGQAKGGGDITLVNEKLAAAIAVTTAPPWAVPRGALIDAAPVVNGVIGRDCIAFADFLPNSWSAWPSTYQHVTIVANTPDLAVVRAVRDWNAVRVETVYSLKSGDDAIHIVVTMTNEGRAPVENILSGLTLWSQGGYFFGVPGMGRQPVGPVATSSVGAMADRIVAYDKTWLIALHEPGFDRFSYGQKDLYRLHTLKSGQSRTFEGWLQVVSSGDMAPVVKAEIARRKLPFASITGTVRTASGATVEAPVVVAEKDGTPYAWTLGRGGGYALDLPVGRYTLYATGEGFSETPRVALTLTANTRIVLDFSGIEPAGQVRLSVVDKATGAPLDARIDIKAGQRPLVEYLGKHTFFTDLEQKGRANIALAPGRYVLAVGAGAGFLSKAVDVEATVAPGEVELLNVAIDRVFAPPKAGWYSADFHHHSDQEDGVTPPEDLVRSELAAGLDVLFVSDHDTTIHHLALQRLADERGVPFIPSIELSPSWGHFNAYPLKLGEPLRLEMNKASVQDVFAEAKRMGATLIQVNHPYDPGEGYFASLDRGVAVGGLDPDFDFLEINGAQADKDDKTLASAWDYWNKGRHVYLSAGSDTHDVWNEASGDARIYVHVDGPLTMAGFLAGLKRGRAFVTHGPLVFPDHMFGEAVKLRAGEGVVLGFELDAIAGLKQATIISQGKPVATVAYKGETKAHLTTPANGSSPGWYALTVEDAAGKKAYTNPIWIETVP
jgi:hypothetical protein